MDTSKSIGALVGLPLIAALFTGLTGLTAAPAAATVAKGDAVTVAAGATATVNVLRNDKVTGGQAKAKVTLASTPLTLKVSITKKKAIKIAPKANTKAGTYRVRYRVTGTKGSSAAAIKVKVTKAKVAKPAPKPKTPATPTLTARIKALPAAEEHTATTYEREAFKHWNKGLNLTDGCDARRETLIDEAVKKPVVGTKCALTGGAWYSYYDGVTITDSSKVDLDHMVPLKEAFDSGAHAWTNAKREAYANDQGDPRSLVGVTQSSNRGKSDRDPGEWLPLKERCRYIAEWVAVKHRWGLSADKDEKAALTYTAKGCADVAVPVTAYAG